MTQFHRSKRNIDHVVSALFISLILSYTFVWASQIYAATVGNVTLSATVATSLSLVTSTAAADQFGTLTPGTYKFATTTLDVLTNDTAGWTVSLAGDNKTSVNSNFQLTGDTATQITDQTEWIPGAATTSAGNAVVRASLASSGNVLAFRVMTASSSNGTAFTAGSWWGLTDADGTAKFAGIASSTVQRTIGNAGTGSYSASNHLNTVTYYLNVSASQKTGAYTAPLTYTAVGN